MTKTFKLDKKSQKIKTKPVWDIKLKSKPNLCEQNSSLLKNGAPSSCFNYFLFSNLLSNKATVCLLTFLLCAERVLLVLLKVRGGGAPQLAVTASVRGTGQVGLPLVDEREDAGQASGVSTVNRSRSICTRT